MITCPPHRTTSNAQVSWSVPAVTDMVDSSPMVSCNPSSGFTFPSGVTTPVTCTATDATGNSAACVFSVTIGVYSKY